jgi:predicted transposase/invertase (TIGR01784 family)
MLAQTNPAMAEAWGVIKRLSADESARMIAESREKALMDFNSAVGSARRKGLQEGEQKGRQEERLEVAQKLLRKKMSYDDIVDATGLSLEEVNQLASGLTE